MFQRPSVAQFFDSTETAYRVADHLYRKDPVAYPKPPTREFVTDADDAHERLLSGANPIVGMSLDDVISLAADGDDPRAVDLVVIAEVVERYGVSRHTITAWRKRYKAGGLDCAGRSVPPPAFQPWPDRS